MQSVFSWSSLAHVAKAFLALGPSASACTALLLKCTNIAPRTGSAAKTYCHFFFCAVCRQCMAWLPLCQSWQNLEGGYNVDTWGLGPMHLLGIEWRGKSFLFSLTSPNARNVDMIVFLEVFMVFATLILVLIMVMLSWVCCLPRLDTVKEQHKQQVPYINTIMLITAAGHEHWISDLILVIIHNIPWCMISISTHGE